MGLTRLFREYALSGEIPKMFLGGNSSDDEVITKKDLLRSKAEMSTQTTYDETMVQSTEYTINLDTVTVAGGVTADVNSNAMAVTKAGLYEIYYGIDVDCDNNDQISLSVSVNGVQNADTTIFTEGRGVPKPIPATWKKSIHLDAGDFLKLIIVATDANITSRIYKAILVVKEDR